VDGKKKMMLTNGACMSLRGERKCNDMYAFLYTAAGPESSSYVVRGIFEGSQEL
jgi:hypothetical protein